MLEAHKSANRNEHTNTHNLVKSFGKKFGGETSQSSSSGKTKYLQLILLAACVSLNNVRFRKPNKAYNS